MHPIIAANMTEDELLNKVISYALYMGWRVHHCRPAHTGRGWRTPVQGNTGFPDLCMVRLERIVIAELKRERARERDDQAAWLDAFRATGAEVYVWRPSDWAEIEKVLAR